jgi:hypothetical protein
MQHDTVQAQEPEIERELPAFPGASKPDGFPQTEQLMQPGL